MCQVPTTTPPGRWEESSGPSRPPAWNDSHWESWNAAASSDRHRWDAAESDAGWGSHDGRSTGSQQAQLDPDVELQWNQITGMRLLENIDMTICPWTYPDDMNEHPWSVESFMMSMHMALKDYRDDSLMDLEKKHFANRAHLAHKNPIWMTLAPPQDLKCWAPILLEQKIDSDAVTDLVHVIRGAHEGNHGYYESIRIIAHLLKDTEHDQWRSGPSAWLHKACTESLTAMLNWDEWDCKYNGKEVAFPPSASSSRASTSFATDPPRSNWDDYKRVTRHGAPGRGMR